MPKELKRVPVTVTLRDNATGEVVKYTEDCNANDDGTPSSFWYDRKLGNAGCDCNRVLFFNRVKDPKFEYDEFPCGESLFDLNLTDSTGHVFYREFADATPD